MPLRRAKPDQDGPADQDGSGPGPEPGPGPGPGPTGGTGRRRRLVVLVAVGAAVVSGAGLGAATLVKSPEQAAADAKPPAASVLTAPVVQRVLANTTVLRGTFAAGQTFAVQPAAVAPSTGGPGGGTPVVSALKAAAGDTVQSRQVIAEVSGRPVFVLPGTIPAYRDMQPGQSGDDIAQLQNVLKGLGISTGGDAKGVFGAGTKTAVGRLYQQLGYPAAVTGEATAAAVHTAQQAVQEQQQVVQDLQDGATAAAGTAGTADTGGGKGGASAPAAADSATRLARAKTLLTQKQQELAQAQAKDGPQLPLSEVLFLPSLPARVAAVPAKVGDKVAAPVMTLTAGGLNLTGHLPPADAALVKPGMKVTVLSESTGRELAAKVGGVGAPVTPGAGTGTGAVAGAGQEPAAGAGAGGSPYAPVTVLPDSPWDPGLDGQDVRITIVEAATSGEVLAVPSSAISSSVDGRTTVTVVAADRSRREVEVTAGVIADNFVQVTAKEGELQPGDQVLVGVAQARPPGASGGTGGAGGTSAGVGAG
ncbi:MULTISPECIES: peptidoglycan-binding protein [Kitasatospora]|nr:MULTISPECIES: peptidoglycan-binding protein [Kitasatospora]